MNQHFCRSEVYRQKIDKFLLHHDEEKLKNSVLMPVDETPPL
jgi:hypothetical protein